MYILLLGKHIFSVQKCIILIISKYVIINTRKYLFSRYFFSQCALRFKIVWALWFDKLVTQLKVQWENLSLGNFSKIRILSSHDRLHPEMRQRKSVPPVWKPVHDKYYFALNAFCPLQPTFNTVGKMIKPINL